MNSRKIVKKHQASFNAVNAFNRSNTVLLMESDSNRDLSKEMAKNSEEITSHKEKGFEEEGMKIKVPDRKSRNKNETESKVFIVNISNAHYPLEILTEHEMELIEETFLSFIDNMEETSICPQFETCCRSNGVLRVVCCDEETQTWLTSILGKIRPWENATLKSLSEFDLDAKYFKISLKKRRSEKHLNQNQFLKRIQTQNKGIQVNQWKVDKIEIEENNYVMYRVAVDEASASTLLARNGILHIGLHKVQAVAINA